MSEKSFVVIGVSDKRDQWFSPDVLEVVRSNSVFSGGKRHHSIVRPLLPPGSIWIDIIVPLEEVWRKYEEYDRIVVFASGDPLFYGYAVTLQREFPNADLVVFPAFTSLQMLAHRMLLPYADMVNVSVTGRPWSGLDTALIEHRNLIGVLTDRKKGPAEIAKRMIRYGYDNYIISVGENLGHETSERVTTFSLNDAIQHSFSQPNCVILQMTHQRQRYFGIPEKEFYHLFGREKMITKMPIRLLTLSMLDLPHRKSLWDIGFCTGSVSIEAKLQFPQLEVTAFERREESRNLLKKNCRKFGVPGINAVIEDFMNCDVALFPRPDAVFIGGHGGRLKDIIARIITVLLPGGVIVFNSVTEQSCKMFGEGIMVAGLSITESHSLTLDNHNTIKILKAQ